MSYIDAVSRDLSRHEQEQIRRDQAAKELTLRTQSMYREAQSTLTDMDLVIHFGDFGVGDQILLDRMVDAIKKDNDLALGRAVAEYVRQRMYHAARRTAETEMEV